jgi:purine-binding chemotaxis protein CheW
MASGVRDDVSHEYTCFIWRGEDERLHGRFLSALGIINVRGQILSVLDLKKFFDLPERGLTDRKGIILHSDQTEFGILAAAILGVRAIPLQAIQPALPTLTGVTPSMYGALLGSRWRF